MGCAGVRGVTALALRPFRQQRVYHSLGSECDFEATVHWPMLGAKSLRARVACCPLRNSPRVQQSIRSAPASGLGALVAQWNFFFPKAITTGEGRSSESSVGSYGAMVCDLQVFLRGDHVLRGFALLPSLQHLQ